MASEQYKVYISPLASVGQYSTKIDVTEYALLDGIGSLDFSLDRYDFNIGTYRFNDFNLTLDNYNGKFNTTGTNSIFTYSRDKSKIEVYFLGIDSVETLLFTGLSNELSTKGSSNNNFIEFNFLSLDSIPDRVEVESGDISNGDTFTVAIQAILNKTAITSVLTYTAGNITPQLNYTIDDVTSFTGLTVKDVLNQLLFASNSIFYTKSNVMYVSDRTVTATAKTTFYGYADTFGRENTLTLSDYNSGYNSIYNSIDINGTISKDATSITAYGLRKKVFTLDFITNGTTETNIGASYLAEFKNPKRELVLTFENKESFTLSFLDEVAIDLIAGKYNNIDILSTDRWKILSITETISNLTKTIKLREI